MSEGTRELLIEIGCEDLPARYVLPLAEALCSGLCEALDKRQIAHGDGRVYATPRRVAALIPEVSERQPDQTIERRGPAVSAAFKDGAPTPAATGFARSCGVEPDQLERISTDKGEWLAFRGTQAGQDTTALIGDIFAEALKRMDQLVPKRMRWGAGETSFVRPVRWLLALFGSEVLTLDALGMSAGAVTYGHRFHAPEGIALSAPSEYEARLNAAQVAADFGDRRERVRNQISDLAASLKATVKVDASLLDEVTALVEWPHAITGQFDERFLELPSEVIVVTIQDHQRYFPVFDDDGRIRNAFITVSNIDSKDMAQVIAGNERVVRPRLEDAMFFWTQDRQRTLESRVEELQAITFQKKLGSVGDKALRISALAQAIAATLGEDAMAAGRAGLLCKADLVSQMVFEFPELQGVMGRYYAVHDGEPTTVSDAIGEHYAPAQSGDPIPSTPLGRVLALADKLDTVAGIFAAGMKPTGSKDPFALRRAAIGVLRILQEGELTLPLDKLLADALAAQPVQTDCLEDLKAFFADRLQALVVDGGMRVEMYRAVAAVEPPTIPDFHARLDALAEFGQRPESEALAAAHKRARNILAQAQWAGGDEVDVSRLEHEAEQALHNALADISVSRDLTPEAYTAALAELAELKPVLERFFDQVMVMVDDDAIRDNRLALLARLDGLCGQIADISHL